MEQRTAKPKGKIKPNNVKKSDLKTKHDRNYSQTDNKPSKNNVMADAFNQVMNRNKK